MTEATEKKPKFERVSSTIQFPYTDMSDAITIAEGLLKGGGVALSRDQLAAALSLAPGGGGFATKLSTARIFGVIDPSSGKYQLTDLGFEIVDAGRQQEAKVKAFLNVELYKRVYDEFRGKLLPPRPHGFENALLNFGVSPKSAKPARLAFEKSARMAGFFPNAAEDRLVMPFGAIGIPGGDESRSSGGATPPPPPPPPPPPLAAPAAAKELEYQLVDLLKLEGIGEEESAAIWTLVRFLTKPQRTLPNIL
jgi:hypothetical protein